MDSGVNKWRVLIFKEIPVFSIPGKHILFFPFIIIPHIYIYMFSFKYIDNIHHMIHEGYVDNAESDCLKRAHFHIYCAQNIFS